MDSYPGISRPVSLQAPSQDDVDASKQLQAVLHEMGAFENEESLKQRSHHLVELEEKLFSWISAKYPETVSEKQAADDVSICKIISFGGQQLGVVCKGGDLDAVCIVGMFVKREDFFKEFVKYLDKCDKTTISRVVEFARVPIIQIIYQGIKIDMCLAVLSSNCCPSVSHIDSRDNNIFRNMDIASINSLNGRRETAGVLSLVPNETTFVETFKVIKFWAKRHFIHHSSLGFPGGIGWAIMVARICQMYPLAICKTLVEKFFTTFYHWDWPAAVLLSPIPENDAHNLKPWNPKIAPTDGLHSMPVITPAYPQKNCTYTVNRFSLSVIRTELQLAAERVQCIVKEREADWSTLFTPKIPFFHRYKHFLVVTAKSESHQDNLDWGGLVESRIRILVAALEAEDSLSLVHCHTVGYDRRETHFNKNWFLGLLFSKKGGATLNISPIVSEFQQHLYTLGMKRNIFKEGMTVTVIHSKRRDLPLYLDSEHL